MPHKNNLVILARRGGGIQFGLLSFRPQSRNPVVANPSSLMTTPNEFGVATRRRSGRDS